MISHTYLLRTDRQADRQTDRQTDRHFFAQTDKPSVSLRVRGMDFSANDRRRYFSTDAGSMQTKAIKHT